MSDFLDHSVRSVHADINFMRAVPPPAVYAVGTEMEVCLDIARRQAMGLAKYGTTVRDNPLSLRQWLQHAYEETLDQAIYLKRAIEQIDKSDSLNKSPA